MVVEEVGSLAHVVEYVAFLNFFCFLCFGYGFIDCGNAESIKFILDSICLSSYMSVNLFCFPLMKNVTLSSWSRNLQCILSWSLQQSSFMYGMFCKDPIHNLLVQTPSVWMPLANQRVVATLLIFLNQRNQSTISGRNLLNKSQTHPLDHLVLCVYIEKFDQLSRPNQQTHVYVVLL